VRVQLCNKRDVAQLPRSSLVVLDHLIISVQLQNAHARARAHTHLIISAKLQQRLQSFRRWFLEELVEFSLAPAQGLCSEGLHNTMKRYTIT
jgi:hypothetical protein